MMRSAFRPPLLDDLREILDLETSRPSARNASSPAPKERGLRFLPAQAKPVDEFDMMDANKDGVVTREEYNLYKCQGLRNASSPSSRGSSPPRSRPQKNIHDDPVAEAVRESVHASPMANPAVRIGQHEYAFAEGESSLANEPKKQVDVRRFRRQAEEMDGALKERSNRKTDDLQTCLREGADLKDHEHAVVQRGTISDETRALRGECDMKEKEIIRLRQCLIAVEKTCRESEDALRSKTLYLATALEEQRKQVAVLQISQQLASSSSSQGVSPSTLQSGSQCSRNASPSPLQIGSTDGHADLRRPNHILPPPVQVHSSRSTPFALESPRSLAASGSSFEVSPANQCRTAEFVFSSGGGDGRGSPIRDAFPRCAPTLSRPTQNICAAGDALFNSIDRNRDGVISRAEWKQATSPCGVLQSPLDTVVNSIGGNNDSVISRAEWNKATTSPPALQLPHNTLRNKSGVVGNRASSPTGCFQGKLVAEQHKTLSSSGWTFGIGDHSKRPLAKHGNYCSSTSLSMSHQPRFGYAGTASSGGAEFRADSTAVAALTPCTTRMNDARNTASNTLKNLQDIKNALAAQTSFDQRGLGGFGRIASRPASLSPRFLPRAPAQLAH